MVKLIIFSYQFFNKKLIFERIITLNSVYDITLMCSRELSNIIISTILALACITTFFILPYCGYTIYYNNKIIKGGYTEYSCPLDDYKQIQIDEYNTTSNNMTTYHNPECVINVFYMCGSQPFIYKTNCNYSICTNETLDLCKNQTSHDPLRIWEFNIDRGTFYNKQQFDKVYKSFKSKTPLALVISFPILLITLVGLLLVSIFWYPNCLKQNVYQRGSNYHDV